MSADKCYAWEHDQFPWHWRVKVRPEFRVLLTKRLAARFGLPSVNVTLTSRTWAWAHGCSWIELPCASHSCSLGMICHEIAHLVNYRFYKGRGHTGTFKRALIKVMVEARTMGMIPAAMAEVRQELSLAAKKASQAASREARQAQRLREAKELRQSPAWRLQHAQERAKRLRTRIKRLQTLLKKAERQARGLERRLTPTVSVSN